MKVGGLSSQRRYLARAAAHDTAVQSIPGSDTWMRLQRNWTRSQHWEAATAEEVRRRVAEIIELADHDALDLIRSRVVEQQVLDTLDDPTTRSSCVLR